MTRNKKPDSVLREAWDNMREDFGRFLPAAGSGKRKWGWHIIALVTLLELVLLGVIGTFIYDWLLR